MSYNSDLRIDFPNNCWIMKAFWYFIYIYMEFNRIYQPGMIYIWFMIYTWSTWGFTKVLDPSNLIANDKHLEWINKYISNNAKNQFQHPKNGPQAKTSYTISNFLKEPQFCLILDGWPAYCKTQLGCRDFITSCNTKGKIWEA